VSYKVLAVQAVMGGAILCGSRLLCDPHLLPGGSLGGQPGHIHPCPLPAQLGQSVDFHHRGDFADILIMSLPFNAMLISGLPF